MLAALGRVGSGLDHAPEMARQAARRNAAAVAAGRLALLTAAVDPLARPGAPHHAALPAAGFAGSRIEALALRPVPAVCLLASMTAAG